jgi:DNA-directed RNA polymerase subunit RPC12/RpoP
VTAEESLPGQGYEPDPPSAFMLRYVCPDCGARYETFHVADHLVACRNTDCNGRPARHRGDWP